MEVKVGVVTVCIDPPDNSTATAKRRVVSHGLRAFECDQLTGGIGQSGGHELAAKQIEGVFEIRPLNKRFNELLKHPFLILGCFSGSVWLQFDGRPKPFVIGDGIDQGSKHICPGVRHQTD